MTIEQPLTKTEFLKLSLVQALCLAWPGHDIPAGGIRRAGSDDPSWAWCEDFLVALERPASWDWQVLNDKNEAYKTLGHEERLTRLQAEGYLGVVAVQLIGTDAVLYADPLHPRGQLPCESATSQR